MKRIELTKEELDIIDVMLKGKISHHLYTEEQQQAAMSVLNKAEELEQELDATDEIMSYPSCNAVAWFFDKYKNQGKE